MKPTLPLIAAILIIALAFVAAATVDAAPTPGYECRRVICPVCEGLYWTAWPNPTYCWCCKGFGTIIRREQSRDELRVRCIQARRR